MTSTVPRFNEKHSLAIRVWHWLFFLLITGTITTVIFATYVYNTGGNIGLVQLQLQEKGILVDQDAARAVSHAFNDLCWEIHTWIGFGIAFLVLTRFLIEFFQPGEERVATRLRRAAGFVTDSPFEDAKRRYYLTIKWVYVLFYGLILIMALTGLGLALEDVSFFRSARRGIKSVHAFVQYPIYVFILVHIAGVIRADMRRYPGLVSSMINGRPGKMLTVLVCAMAAGLLPVSCTPVKEYQKNRINDSEMSLSSRKVEKNESNFQSYREGAAGANGGKTGGGCGCN